MTHITQDLTEADMKLPTIHFSQTFKYKLEWHHGHILRQKDDLQQCMTKEAANVEADKLAGRACYEE